MNYKLIQFILQELKNSPEDRERFNKISFFECKYILRIDAVEFGGMILTDNPVKLQYIIRTALSRVDGKAVLSAFNQEHEIIAIPDGDGGFYSYSADKGLYEIINSTLFMGGTLQEALEACEDYFEEVEGIITLKI